ncbi:MAG: hypothetical protein K6T29_06975 [Peptococcaceae bacterium]|nr:hypothetical protein [Peptococcaceae bacterium]
MSCVNEWQVYEFCKRNRGVLINLPVSAQMKYLKKRFPDVDSEILAEGLLEFRSVPPHNWEPQVARAAK